MKRTAFLATIAVVLALGGTTSIHAQTSVCITFDGIVDAFEGVATDAGGGHFALALLELGGERAAYGSMRVRGSQIFAGWTKATNAGVVAFTCDLDRATRVGPCSASVLLPELPGLNEVVEDTATLTLGPCPARARARGEQLGLGETGG